jgi:hypothetical protein
MVTHTSGSFFIDTNSVEVMLEWLHDAGFKLNVFNDGNGMWSFGLAAAPGATYFHQATGACLRDGVRDMLSAALTHQQQRSA